MLRLTVEWKISSLLSQFRHRPASADLIYVKTHSGRVYAAFIHDVFSRLIVGRQASQSLRSDLALDALEMTIWAHRGASLDGLVDHSDRGA